MYIGISVGSRELLPGGHLVVTQQDTPNLENSRKTILSKARIDKTASQPERYTLWDVQVPGFGLRISPNGKKVFILRYRPRRASSPKRYLTIGPYGVLTADEARKRAIKVLAAVFEGKDPAARAIGSQGAVLVSEAVAKFLAEHIQLKRKPKTASSYGYALNRYVLPELGKRKLLEVTREEVNRLHRSLSAVPYMANCVLTILSSLYSWAERQSLVPEGFNPARRIEKFRESRREIFLSSSELLSIGEALRVAETRGLPWSIDNRKITSKHLPGSDQRFAVLDPFAVAALRLLLFTGCRLQEILTLRWEHVDFQRRALFLPDSKTGRKTVVLGAPALKVLSDLPRTTEYVIPGTSEDKPRVSLKRPWAAIKRYVQLPKLRLHDLRHSYASIAAGAGIGLPIIGKLLGHAQPSTTARYTHLADDPLRRASESIASQIAAAMGEAQAECEQTGNQQQVLLLKRTAS